MVADPNELAKLPQRFEAIRPIRVPKGGWIRAVRKDRGLTLNAVAKRMNLHRQNVRQSEKAEETGQILLWNLRRIAEAMDCELVYAIIPKRRRTKTSRNASGRLGPG